MKRGLLTLMFASALVVELAVVTPLFGQGNLLVNPGFEDGGGSYTGWFTFGNGPQISTSATDNIFRTGVAASKIFGEFNNCPPPKPIDVGGYGQIFTPTAGKGYQLNGFSFVSSADQIPGSSVCTENRAIAKIVFFDAPVFGNELASNEVVIADYSTPTNQWRPFSVETGPAPAAAVRVEALILFLQPGCDTGSVYIDDLDLREVTLPSESNLLANPDFSSGTTGWSTFGNAFSDLRPWAGRTQPGGCKMFGTFNPDDNSSGIFQSFTAAPGSEWKLQVYSLVTCLESPIEGTNDNFGIAQILFTNSLGDSIGAVEQVIADATAPLGKWTKHTLTGTAPAGTANAEAFILFIQPTNPLLGGAMWVDDVLFNNAVLTGIDDTPAVARLKADNYPNPFNPTTTIRFVLPEATHVTLDVYDVSGALITTLVDEARPEGFNTATWNATNAQGATVGTGVYYYKLRTSRETLTRKMVLLK